MRSRLARLALCGLVAMVMVSFLPSVAGDHIRLAEVSVVINGDAEFEASPYVAGDGLMMPYTISNVVASRIEISNVTKSFTMASCTVHGIPTMSGVVLANCTGAVGLRHTNVDNAYQGIYIENSDVSIAWGTIQGCTRNAVVLIRCHEPNVEQLIIKNNALGGIYVYDCYKPNIHGFDAEVPVGAQYFAYIGAGTRYALIYDNLIITTIATPFVDYGDQTFLHGNTVRETRPPPQPPSGGGDDDDPPSGGNEPPTKPLELNDFMPFIIIVILVVVLLSFFTSSTTNASRAFLARIRHRSPPPPPPEPPFVVVGGVKQYLDGDRLVLNASVIAPAVITDAADIEGLADYKIRYLDVSGHKLRSLDFMRTLSSLEEIVVDDNEIESLGPGIPRSLTRVYANHNKIQHVALEYGCLLEVVELQGNAVSGLGGLSFASNLQVLRLGENPVDARVLERLGGLDDDGYFIDVDRLQQYFRDPVFKREVLGLDKRPVAKPVEPALAEIEAKPPEPRPVPVMKRKPLSLGSLLEMCVERFSMGVNVLSRRQVLEKFEEKGTSLGELVNFLEKARLVRLFKGAITLSDAFGYRSLWNRVKGLGFDDAGLKDTLMVLKDVQPAGKLQALNLIFPPF